MIVRLYDDDGKELCGWELDDQALGKQFKDSLPAIGEIRSITSLMRAVDELTDLVNKEITKAIIKNVE